MGMDIYKATGSPANPGWVTEKVHAHIRQNLKPETRVAYGHMAFYGMHRLATWPVTPRYVVFLRDPIERIISLYYYLRDMSPNFWHHELVNAQWDIADWLEKSKALWHHNGQVRQLLIGTEEAVLTERELSAAHLETAKRILRDFWFVGLTETYQPDAYFLYNQLGLRKFTAEERINANPKKPGVPKELRELIARYNPLDMALYEYARQRRAAWQRTHMIQYWANGQLTRYWRYLDRRRTAAPDGKSQARSVEQR
jgi:hypothetical protein